MNNPVRLECYAAIKQCVSTMLVKYVEENPHLIVEDERAVKGMDAILEVFRCLFHVLDQYDIVRRVPKDAS